MSVGRGLQIIKEQSRSLRVRLTLWYLAVLLLTLGTSAIVLYVGVARALRGDIDSSLEHVAGDVLDTRRDGTPRLDQDALPPGYAATLRAPGGVPLTAGGAEPTLPLTDDVGIVLVQGRQVTQSIDFGPNSWRVLTRPVVIDGRVVGTLQVGRSEEPVESALERLGLLMLALVPLAALLAAAGGMFLARRAFDPIDRMTRTAAAIGGENLTRRLPDEVARMPGDLGRLASTFNHMLDRLEGAFQRQRQFTADASHELRAPLAVLLSQVDIALQRPRTDVEYEVALHSVRDDVIRLRQLVDLLLTLARADARKEVLKRERIDLGELVQQVAEAMSPRADELSIRLRAQPTEGVFVDGDQSHLMQLLVNLTENALKYTPAGGTVTVAASLGADQGHALLSVWDTGCGIAAEHLPHLFERFYRVDPARSTGGTGLGLAISSWIAEAHGGRIDVQSQPGVGSTFTVRLPRCTPTATQSTAGAPARQVLRSAR